MLTVNALPYILIVEDDPDTAASYRMLLQISGYRTSVASDGADAILSASAELPAAVLLDLGLPDIDGCDVARSIRNLGGVSRPFILAVTARGGDEARKAAAVAGVDLHVTKPADPAFLSRLLDAAVKRIGTDPSSKA